MSRLSLALVIFAALALAVSALWIGLDQAAPGRGSPGGVLPYPALLTAHGLAGAMLLPLLGAFAGFASPGRAARLAGWNGLAVAVALAVFLVITDPAATVAIPQPLIAGLVPGTAPIPDLSGNRGAIADAAGLWALFAGLGAMLGAAPGMRWGGRAIQLLAGIFCATYLLARTGDAPEPQVAAQLILPALAVFAVATLHLMQEDTAPAPHLWIGAALLLWTLTTTAGSFGVFEAYAGTMVEVAHGHRMTYGLVPFALVAAWRGHRGLDHGGLWAWGHATVLAALWLAWTWPLYQLGYDGMPRGGGDFSRTFAPGIRETAALGALTILWTALGFILPAGTEPARSAAHTS